MIANNLGSNDLSFLVCAEMLYCYLVNHYFFLRGRGGSPPLIKGNDFCKLFTHYFLFVCLFVVLFVVVFPGS